MRRMIAIALLFLLGVSALVFGVAAEQEDQAKYSVKAIFDTASNVNVGGDLKVAGVVVGSVGSIELTENNKAAITLHVKQKGIGPFKEDARCEIIVTSLIGEQPIQCEPGSADAAVLETPPGEKLPVLPVTRTGVPVPVDRVLDNMREPTRERFRIFINELGISFAARGDDLAKALRRSTPALRQMNRVLKILDRQNDTLSKLVTTTDQVMEPLARDKRAVADSIVQINSVAQATAARREEIRESIDRFPPLLRELKPTMEQIGKLSDEAAPILADLNAVAPDISRFIVDLGPFAEEAVPTLQSLGDTADLAGPILTKSDSLIEKIDTMTISAKPASQNLAALLTDLQDTGGIERFMDMIFYLGSASGMYDSVSHFIPNRLLANTCVDYATSGKVQPACKAKFTGRSSKSASTASSTSEGQEELLDYLLGD